MKSASRKSENERSSGLHNPSSERPYVYPGTNTLRNKFGLRDAQTLQALETSLSYSRLAELDVRPLLGKFDLAHLRAIHRHIFQDVYDWAGQVRTVSIAKANSLFALPEHIESYAAAIFAGLERENHLRGLGRKVFIKQAAYYLGEINALHPFREGNGRAQRAFMQHLAIQAGYRFDWMRTGAEEMVSASIAAFDGELGGLERLLTRCLSQ